MNEYKDIRNKENIIEGIDEEYQDLAAELLKIDFSKQSNKISVLGATFKGIKYKRADNEKKIKKAVIAAASLIIVSTLIAQTTFAKDVIRKIIKSISLGYFTVEQYVGGNEEDNVLSDNLRGKLFDKNGNEIEKLTKDIVEEGIYTRDGEKVNSWSTTDGSITTEKQAEEEMITISDNSKINNYISFEAKLPNYLPEGYKFEKAEFFKGDSNLVNLFFINQITGKEIYIREKCLTDGRGLRISTYRKIENINVNNEEAVLEDEGIIYWEKNNIAYYLDGGNRLSKNEIMKIAESIN